jgi:hypothetical protein
MSLEHRTPSEDEDEDEDEDDGFLPRFLLPFSAFSLFSP